MLQPHRSTHGTSPCETALPPPFACTTAYTGRNAAWIHVTGELDLAVTDQLERSLTFGLGLSYLVVLDLRGVVFMDVTGVHAVVAASAEARLAGRRLIVVWATDPVDRVLGLTLSDGQVTGWLLSA